eukprot:1098465-Pyramimonas_sp.AAC.1
MREPPFPVPPFRHARNFTGFLDVSGVARALGVSPSAAPRRGASRGSERPPEAWAIDRILIGP